jgi:predicted flap endonuclease-1-like 5' DNA nuclease
MGPMLWWWRWWLGGDPNRDRQLIEARNLLDEQRAEADELEVRLTAEADQVRAEADKDRTRLTAELDQARAEADKDRTRLTAELDQARAEAAELHTRERALADARAELDALRARMSELEAERDDAPVVAAPAGANVSKADELDMSAAKEVLGAKVTLDDLTLVDGVGPKIAGLLSDAGIDTWLALGDADVERLRDVLAEAGPRYRMHDPQSWPAQGQLLAEGRWREFKDLAER